MFIDISEIRKSPGYSMHFDLTMKTEPIEIGSDEVVFEQLLIISLDVKNSGRTLIVNGKIDGDAILICSRCLEKFSYHLNATFEEQFCQASNLAKAAEEGISSDELHVFEGSRILIDDIIQESVVLGIPMKMTCKDNCKGLCAVCGSNKNRHNCGCEIESVDLRLEVLKKYFER